MSFRRFLLSFVWFPAWTHLQSVTCLTLNFQQRWHSISFASSETSTYQVGSPVSSNAISRGCQPRLMSKRNNNDDEKSEIELVMDPGLWTTDFLALILASQLIGLLDVINSPEFTENGGWFQPIPAVPSTLDDLVQRISSFGISWAIASASVIFLAKIKQSLSDASAPNKSDGDQHSAITINSYVQTLIIFGIVQFLFQTFFHGSSEASDFAYSNADMTLGALRNSYFVGLSTVGLRYLYRQYFLP